MLVRRKRHCLFAGRRTDLQADADVEWAALAQRYPNEASFFLDGVTVQDAGAGLKPPDG